MRTQRFCWKSQFCLHFVNKIYLPYRCVVFFCCLPAPQADLARFRRVIVLAVEDLPTPDKGKSGDQEKKSGDSTKNSEIQFLRLIKPLFHRGNQTPTSFPGPTPLSKWRTDAENNDKHDVYGRPGTADGKRQILPLFFYSFHVILK